MSAIYQPKPIRRPAWCGRFLAVLAETGQFWLAAERAGTNLKCVFRRKRSDITFAAAVKQALREYRRRADDELPSLTPDRHRLVLLSMPTARKLAREALRTRKCSREDCLQLAYLALVRAAANWDEAASNGGKFNTYATTFIKHSLRRDLTRLAAKEERLGFRQELPESLCEEDRLMNRPRE